MKKSKSIYIIKNGKKIESENVKKTDLSFIIERIEKMNKISLTEIEKNTYSFKRYILIFRPFLRSHTPSKNQSINENEYFRSRYTKNDLIKFKNLYQNFGKYIFFLSYYDTVDKIILVGNEITPILFKKEISSDSRINNMMFYDFKKAYKNKFWIKKYNENAIFPFSYVFQANFFVDFFEKINDYKIESNDYKINFKEYNAKDNYFSWKKFSFQNIKKFLINKNIKSFIGELGEYIAFSILIKKYENKKVIWSSKLKSNSNHDIQVENNEFYEIKSTKNSKINSFFISENEKKFGEEKEKWFLWFFDLFEINKFDFNILKNENQLSEIIEKKISNDEINYKEFNKKSFFKLKISPIKHKVKL